MLGTETRLSLGRCTVFELKFLIKGINMIFKNYILLNPKEVYALEELAFLGCICVHSSSTLPRPRLETAKQKRALEKL